VQASYLFGKCESLAQKLLLIQSLSPFKIKLNISEISRSNQKKEEKP